jgi:hypothetical protein
VACLYSPVLKAAFTSAFIEGQTQTYFLKHTTADAFQLLVQWLYGKTFNPFLTQVDIDSIAKGSWSSTLAKSRKIGGRQRDLINVWVVADYLKIPGAQNLAIDELEQIRKDWDKAAHYHFDYVYEKLPSGSPMRELLFEYCLRFVGALHYKARPDSFPKQLLLDIVIAQKDPTTRPNPFADRAAFKKRFHVPEDC